MSAGNSVNFVTNSQISGGPFSYSSNDPSCSVFLPLDLCMPLCLPDDIAVILGKVAVSHSLGGGESGDQWLRHESMFLLGKFLKHPVSVSLSIEYG